MPRLLLIALLLTPAVADAGLHYSAESYAELPSRWRGFLLDQRALRLIAQPATAATPASAMRTRYEQEAARLRAKPARTADESADLGAILVRLGDPAGAAEVLRPAAKAHPVHFRLAANLGTAWHLLGDYAQAAAALEVAVRLAPGRVAEAEKLHLRLVRQRRSDKANTSALDDLFGGVRFVGPGGRYEAGIVDVAELKKLPSAAIARVQQLALWLPHDARLLWQLAELSNAAGDVVTAAAMIDGCVTEFGLRSADLQAHRKILRPAADAILKKVASGSAEDHGDHGLPFKPRSSRPLVNAIGLAALPGIDAKGVNQLPWEVIAETTVDRRARPTFAKYLHELDGKQVVLYGYMHPLGDDTDLAAFLVIEHPVGCWYCEMPETTNLVLAERPKGVATTYTRDRLKITGTLSLNATDPENFLYTIKQAKVSRAAGE